MKFKLMFLFTVLFLGVLTMSSCSFNNENFDKVKFNKVVDGDTIKVSIDGELRDVNLLFVNSPSLRGKYPFSIESKKYLEKKLLNSEYVYLEFDDNYDKVDNYGKINAYVWYYNEGNQLELLNNSIVLEGFGYVSSLSESHKYIEQLNASENEARNKGRNIWSIYGYVTENGYNSKIELEG